jgi:hypothetical protein
MKPPWGPLLAWEPELLSRRPWTVLAGASAYLVEELLLDEVAPLGVEHDGVIGDPLVAVVGRKFIDPRATKLLRIHYFARTSSAYLRRRSQRTRCSSRPSCRPFTTSLSTSPCVLPQKLHLCASVMASPPLVSSLRS